MVVDASELAILGVAAAVSKHVWAGKLSLR